MAEYIADRELKSVRRVLCATDLTTRSEAAVERAVALARQAGARLTVVHAISNRESGRTRRLRSPMNRRTKRLRFRRLGGALNQGRASTFGPAESTCVPA